MGKSYLTMRIYNSNFLVFRNITQQNIIGENSTSHFENINNL